MPRRVYRCQQARLSTSFVDSTIDLPWRNFLGRTQGQSSRGKYPYFGDSRLSAKYNAWLVEGSSHSNNQLNSL